MLTCRLRLTPMTCVAPRLASSRNVCAHICAGHVGDTSLRNRQVTGRDAGGYLGSRRPSRCGIRAFLGILLGLVGCEVAQAKLILVAHRGASAQAPENTMAAFNRAKIVADFVECDVWPTR